MTGKVLGNRYEIMKEIGRGGMALVYLAHCRVLKRNVAIKILRPELAGDPEFLKRFNTEAQAAAGLSHPNIVNVYDFGTEGDLHYIVMEYVEGETLKQYIDSHGMLPWQQCVDFAIQIAQALEHAHRNGVIHRDIKPHNIILTPNMTLKVTDFGIARAASAATMTMSNSTMGSVHYFSPEQARGGYTDAKSDIYSLGVLMYEMATGRLPFDGETPVAIAVMHLQQTPTSPKLHNLSLPTALEQVILKAMSKEQAQRYQSATEMLKDLHAVRKNAPNMPVLEPVAPAPIQRTVRTKPISQNVPPPKNRPKTKQSEAHADKRAVIFAIITSVVLVSMLIVGVIALVSPGLMGPAKDEMRVPDLRGLDFETVKNQYEAQGIIISKISETESDEYEKGQIVEQDPKAGTNVKIKMFKQVSVVVSSGAEPITLPDFSNKTFTDAKIALTKLGLEVEETKENNENIPEGLVIRTVPMTNSKVKQGSTVTVYVSSGPQKLDTVMPNLLGETLANAKRILAEYNLSEGKITETNSSKPKNTIIGQSVSSGASVAEYTKINLTVSSGNADSADTAGTGETKERSITISVPQTKEKTAIKVVVDGAVIHDEVHNKSEKAFSLTIRGKGTLSVQVFHDGALANTTEVTL